jgi:DNA-binding transcriptional ArsR family regulator
MSFAQVPEPDGPAEIRYATAEQLQALAHPIRIQLLEALRRGPATATQLGQRIGESSGSTSYHLRVLGKAGVIVEDFTRRRGRERWWRRPDDALFVVPTGSDDPDTRAAEARFRAYFAERDERALRAYVEHEPELDADWRAAAFIGSWTIALTADEVLELGHRFLQLVDDLRSRPDPPPGSESVAVSFRALPEPPLQRRGEQGK